MPWKKGESGNPAGRQPDKAKAEVREAAAKHGAKAIKELARLALNAEAEATRVSAIRELLDRGFGKSPQTIANEDDEPFKVIYERRVIR